MVAERTAWHEAEARATGAEAMIAHLKLMIARLQRDRFGPTSERSRRLLDQLELQLEELEANGSEDEVRQPEPVGYTRRSAPQARLVRRPLPWPEVPDYLQWMARQTDMDTNAIWFAQQEMARRDTFLDCQPNNWGGEQTCDP